MLRPLLVHIRRSTWIPALLSVAVAFALAAPPEPPPDAGAPPPGRPPSEWQGMRISLNDKWPCIDGFCSLARACVDGSCVACREDRDCELEERCVLEHCVRDGLVGCRRAADCARPDERCVLTGITVDDPRGNRDLAAVCRFVEQ